MFRTVSTTRPDSTLSFTDRLFSEEIVATPVHRLGEQRVVDRHHAVVLARDHPGVVREGAVDNLGGQRRARPKSNRTFWALSCTSIDSPLSSIRRRAS